MSFFAFHYILTMLEEMGWPRRKGVLNSKAVINSLVADTTIENMLEFAAAIGACRPKLALQILTCMFKDRDWESSDAPHILVFISSAKEEWLNKGSVSPKEIVDPAIVLSKYGNTVDASLLNDRKIQGVLEQDFLTALLWGLTCPENFENWYEEDRKRQMENMPEYNAAGIDVDHIPTLSQYLDECEKMISAYEQKMGKLPSIPARLLEDAKVLGRTVDL